MLNTNQPFTNAIINGKPYKVTHFNTFSQASTNTTISWYDTDKPYHINGEVHNRFCLINGQINPMDHPEIKTIELS